VATAAHGGPFEFARHGHGHGELPESEQREQEQEQVQVLRNARGGGGGATTGTHKNMNSFIVFGLGSTVVAYYNVLRLCAKIHRTRGV
jgi:hypothetical protein